MTYSSGVVVCPVCDRVVAGKDWEKHKDFHTHGCREVWPAALEYGEVIECVKRTPAHRRHTNKSGSMRWWGPRLSDAQYAEADRIRALGGVDREKGAAYFAELQTRTQPSEPESP